MNESSLARLRFQSEHYSGQLLTNRLALHPHTDQLLFLSAAGPATTIKAFTALLHLEKPPQLDLRDCPWEHGHAYRATLHTGKGAYQRAFTNLGCNTWHVRLTCSRAGFVQGPGDLWSELTGSLYSTPLLDTWLPWLREKLIADGHLRSCPQFGMGYGAPASFLEISQEALDEIASQGVKNGAIKI